MTATGRPHFEPPNWLEREQEVLAPYAMLTEQSRGRRHPEEPHPFRTLYQRDRDRIVHSTAFRRLMYKTQVLVSQTNDHHRTRLTHTLEVAQISRTVARQLGLNEDLTEAIALAHDLGHPPFGHAGEEALDECMREHGGFEHNQHGLRIVEHLEYRYADFPGINLSWEVLEALAMHSKRREAPELQEFEIGGQLLLEAQVVDAADSLAYDTHDLDDALSAGLITPGDLQEVEFWKRAEDVVRQRHQRLGPEQFQATMVRALINWQVTDLLEHTQRRLRQESITTVEEVRQAPEPLVLPGPEVRALKTALERFLHERVYRHYRVARMANKGRRFLQLLFAEFCRRPEEMPQRYAARARAGQSERAVCDYLAGMTDRYAQDEYLRLFEPYTNV
ncbi:MAG TPA: deoxyguanosinetriphosphate triphosphohydrolase [Gemmataceae bacterium]|nr:deoxyguanosinetriphosphate triphosphohydrolase [Gemmataceae bacterium]